MLCVLNLWPMGIKSGGQCGKSGAKREALNCPWLKHVRCNPYVAPRRNQKSKYIIVHSTYSISYITSHII